MRRRIAAVAVATLLLLGLAVAPASAVMKWPAVGGWYSATTGGTSGWSQSPNQSFAPNVDGYGLSVWLGEAYLVGGKVQLDAKLFPKSPQPPPGAPWPSLAGNWILTTNAICQNTSSFVYSLAAPNSPRGRGGSFYDYQGNRTIDLLTSADAASTCPSGTVPAGVQVVIQWWDPNTPTQTRVVKWYADNTVTWSGPDDNWCRQVFGYTYTDQSTAVIGGQTVTAASVGCKGFTSGQAPDVNTAAENASTDFDTVCAHAPSATWAVWDWLGPWVGHYAKCLFVPTAIDPGSRIKIAFDQSALGPITTAMSALGNVGVTPSCGQIISGSLMGSSLNWSTCSIGDRFATVRTLIGYGVVIFGMFKIITFVLTGFGITGPILPNEEKKE